MTYQIVLPSTEEHPRQHEFIYSEKKRKIIRAGRRGGKTTGVAILAVLEFLKGKAVDYAAPVIEQVGKFWHEVVTALAEPIEFGIYRKLESEKTIFEPGTEHYIHCRTAWNPDTLRGGSTDLLIFDEFQMMHEETWSAAGSPRLIDRNGDAVFICQGRRKTRPAGRSKIRPLLMAGGFDLFGSAGVAGAETCAAVFGRRV